MTPSLGTGASLSIYIVLYSILLGPLFSINVAQLWLHLQPTDKAAPHYKPLEQTNDIVDNLHL